MKYRPEIDGLRAIAVVPVLAFHAEFPLFSGGFVGVDVFFVISGFLITKLIIEGIEQGNFSFTSFYERRARRLIPVLLLVLTVSFAAALFVLPPSDLKNFAGSVLSSLFSVSNIFFWHDTGYFATHADLKPLLHTWSLSVEEQYYLLFPACLVLAYKFRVLAIWFCIALVVVSFWLAVVITPRSPSAAFYLLPTRLWELAIGAVCALLPVASGKAPRLESLLAIIGLGMILWAVFFLDASTPVPGPLIAIPVLGAALVLTFGHRKTSVGALLSLPVCVGIGLISYSLYLWHQPLFVFVRMLWVGTLPVTVTALVICVAILLAFLSWRFVERPFRVSSAPLLPRPAAFFTALASMTAILSALAVSALMTDGFAGRFNPELLSKVRAVDDVTRIRACTANFDATEAKPCTIGAADTEAPVIVVLGDSHASQWLPAFDLIAQERGWRFELFAKSACPSASVNFVAPELKREYVECSAWRQSAFKKIQVLKPSLVVLTNSSEGYLESLGARNLTPATWQLGTNTTVAALAPHAGYVAILIDNPQFRDFDPRLCVARALLLKTVDLERCATTRDDALNTRASAVERAANDVNIIDLSDSYCRHDSCLVYNDGIISMRDSNHLSLPMTEHLAGDLADRMAVIMKTRRD